MSYERKSALNNMKKSIRDRAKQIAAVFDRVDPDHESSKLCPRCIREHKRILMGISYNPTKPNDGTVKGKRVFVCGTCQLQVSEAIGQTPITGALNKDDIVSLINAPEGHPKITPSELAGYSKRHPQDPDDQNSIDSRYLKDIIADLEKNHLANLHGQNRFVFKRPAKSTDIHN